MRQIQITLFFLLVFGKTHGQVNSQTGSSTFSVPVFSWLDDKSRLSSSISLNYNSGNGLKVDDVASNIGQGWDLLAGGSIIRVQAGQPDDQKPRDGSYDDESKYPAGYLYNYLSPANGIPQRITNFPIFDHQNQKYRNANEVIADTEVDKFVFHFNGRTGSFVLNKDNATPTNDIGIAIGDNKLKIWFERDETLVSQGIRTTITAFYIKDENGITYKFRKHGLTKILINHSTDASLSYPMPKQPYNLGSVNYESSFDENPSSPSGVPGNPFIISGWYLTEVTDPLSQRSITINYVERHIFSTSSNEVSTIRTAIGSYGNFSADQWYVLVSKKLSNVTVPVITSIVYPDGHRVDMDYDMARPRVDLNGDYPLGSITTSLNTRNISKHVLNTTYFMLNVYGLPLTEAEKKSARLCLKSVQKLGVDLKDIEPPYAFDYFLGSGGYDLIPPPFCPLKDVWGYYNGNMANSINTYTPPIFSASSVFSLTYQQLRSLCFIYYGNSMGYSLNYNTINPGYAKNGLLKSVTYPMGGSINYEYLQRQYYYNSQNTNTGGVSVSSVISKKDNSTFATRVDYQYQTLIGQYSSLSGIEQPNNKYTSQFYYAPENRHWTWEWSCFPFGCCHYEYTDPGIINDVETENVVSKNMDFANLALELGKDQFVRQAMKAAHAQELIGNKKLLSKFCLQAQIIEFLAKQLVATINSCISDDQITRTSFIYTNYNMMDVNPLPVFYKRVEMVQENQAGTSDNGKTVHEFTSPDDYPIWEPTNDAQAQKQRYAPWAYGLPKKTTVYNSAGNKITETENEYSFSNAKTDLSVVSCKGFLTKTSSLNSAAYFGSIGSYVSTSTADLLIDIYHIYSGRVELTRQRDRIYKPGSSTVHSETVTDYGYNNLNFKLNSIRVTQSNGDRNGKDIYYPLDYNMPSSPIQTLVDNNIVDVPIAEYNRIFKRGTYAYLSGYTGASVSEYAILPSGNIKPSRVLTGRNTQTQSFTFSPTSLLNYPDLAETQAYYYDQNDKLIGIKDDGDRVVSNIYDYNGRSMVASVVNAHPITDKVAYTSFETTSLGGWSLTGTATYSTTQSITGTSSLTLGSGNVISIGSLNASKTYKLTFWSSSHLTVSNYASELIGPTINGLTYYEYTMQASATSLSISGLANVDELRLFPQNARMRTITYDPVIGKTSECDDNNRITYYEYDSFGRIRFIRDEKKNIVKMYEYNTKK